MIECKLWRPARRMPLCVGCIISRLSADASIKHGGEYNADRVAARIATRISERPNLLEVNSGQTGFFEEFPAGRIFERLILVDEAAGECP